LPSLGVRTFVEVLSRYPRLRRYWVDTAVIKMSFAFEMSIDTRMHTPPTASFARSGSSLLYTAINGASMLSRSPSERSLVMRAPDRATVLG